MRNYLTKVKRIGRELRSRRRWALVGEGHKASYRLLDLLAHTVGSFLAEACDKFPNFVQIGKGVRMEHALTMCNNGAL